MTDAPSTNRSTPERNPLKRLYHWVLGWAKTPYGYPAMAALAFSEAICIPIPADVLLLALCMGRPKKSFSYAAVCVSFSILGGTTALLLGYLIGGEQVKAFLETLPYLGPKVGIALDLYKEYFVWAVAVSALTPVPYMLFSWLGGFAVRYTGESFGKFALLFVITSIVFRSGRFFSEAALVYFFGERAKPFIEKYFNLLTVVVIVIMVVAALLITRH